MASFFDKNQERKKEIFHTDKELSTALAEYTAKLSTKYCTERGYFTVVLSGGYLINLLSELLKPSYRDTIEWDKWHIFFVDERIIPLKGKDSNYNLAMNGFLSKVGIRPENIHGICPGCVSNGTVESLPEHYERDIKALMKKNIVRTHKATGFPQFDLQLLGMGPDGHMASLFPGHSQIFEKTNFVTFATTTNSPDAHQDRITFTLKLINCASHNLMAVCYKAQADAVAKVFRNNIKLPAAHLSADIEAIWYLDQAAASKISYMKVKERKKEVLPTKEKLSMRLAEYTAELSAKFCKERGYFTVVLSGGDLISLLSELSKPKFLETIEWKKWHIFWADEKVLPMDSKDSNYKLAWDGFLSKVPIPPANIYPIDQDCAALNDPKGAALLYEECLKRLVNRNIIRTYKASGLPQFDLQLLGMGTDGHIASLYPRHYHIDEKAKLVTFITDAPKPSPNRITFTLPLINCASYNVMAICGEKVFHDNLMALTVEKVYDDDLDLPAAWLTADTETRWFFDDAAASKLKTDTEAIRFFHQAKASKITTVNSFIDQAGASKLTTHKFANPFRGLTDASVLTAGTEANSCLGQTDASMNTADTDAESFLEQTPE